MHPALALITLVICNVRRTQQEISVSLLCCLFLCNISAFETGAAVSGSLTSAGEKTEGGAAVGICTVERRRSRKTNVLSAWTNKEKQGERKPVCDREERKETFMISTYIISEFIMSSLSFTARGLFPVCLVVDVPLVVSSEPHVLFKYH